MSAPGWQVGGIHGDHRRRPGRQAGELEKLERAPGRILIRAGGTHFKELLRRRRRRKVEGWSAVLEHASYAAGHGSPGFRDGTAGILGGGGFRGASGGRGTAFARRAGLGERPGKLFGRGSRGPAAPSDDSLAEGDGGFGATGAPRRTGRSSRFRTLGLWTAWDSRASAFWDYGQLGIGFKGGVGFLHFLELAVLVGFGVVGSGNIQDPGGAQPSPLPWRRRLRGYGDPCGTELFAGHAESGGEGGVFLFPAGRGWIWRCRSAGRRRCRSSRLPR